MPNTKILGYTEQTTPNLGDAFVIADSPTTNKYITVQNLVYKWIADVDADGKNLIGMAYINWDKIAKPSDPPAEEGRMYMKEIDSDNNGILCLIQKGATIVEVQIA